MRIFIAILVFFSMAGDSFANDSYWDLNVALSHAEKHGEAKLIIGEAVVATLPLDYLKNLNQINKKISDTAKIYPKFLISNSTAVNAYATFVSGQPVTIFTIGLLGKVGTDYDALAAVVGHEYAHLSLRHSSSRESTKSLIDLLGGIALIAIDLSYGGAAQNRYRGAYQTGVNLTSSLIQNSYSRADELEADTLGVKYMMAAGYMPDGAIRLQQNIIPSSASFFSTHPSSQSRIQNIKKASVVHDPIPKNNDQSTVISNVSRESKTYSESVKYRDSAQICMGKNIDKKSSKFDVCVLQETRRQFETGLPKNFSEDAVNTKTPSDGQIGTVLSVNIEKKLIVFSSSLPTLNNSYVFIQNDSSNAKATILRYFDGYYLASIENPNATKLGARVILPSD